MVISYDPDELMAIGRMVAINEAMVVCQNAQLKQHHLTKNCLSSSVADFFKKGTINFHPQTSIDPTKVRRLSDVEAEIMLFSSKH